MLKTRKQFRLESESAAAQVLELQSPEGLARYMFSKTGDETFEAAFRAEIEKLSKAAHDEADAEAEEAKAAQLQAEADAAKAQADADAAAAQAEAAQLQAEADAAAAKAQADADAAAADAAKAPQ